MVFNHDNSSESKNICVCDCFRKIQNANWIKRFVCVNSITDNATRLNHRSDSLLSLLPALLSVSLEPTSISRAYVAHRRSSFQVEIDRILKANKWFEKQINHENNVSVLYAIRRRENGFRNKMGWRNTYDVDRERSYFLWVQRGLYLRLDKWISHWDRIVERLATIVDFQLHRRYCVRIDHRPERHLRAIEPAAAVDL